MTRAGERGTMENLLAAPAPFEVMVGKILPYVALGRAAGRDLCWPPGAVRGADEGSLRC